IGLFFLLHREKLLERALGAAVVFGGLIGIFCSGSRGGFVGAIAASASFVAFYSIRKAASSKTSLAPAISAVLGIIGFGCITGLIMASHTIHDTVLGGAAQATSTQARYDQWMAAIPYIKSNPITGHGFGMGGSIFGDYTIDSYMLSLILETGI